MSRHPTLQQLIAQRRDETGWTVRALAAATDGAISHQTMSDIATGKRKEWPKSTATVTGLARALNLSEQTIILAYAAGIGFTIETPSMLAAQLPATADRLTGAERNHIVGLVHALTAGREDPDVDETSA